MAAWRAEPRTTPSGQPHYSALAITTAALAITTALTLRTVFHLALRTVFHLALRQTRWADRLDPRSPGTCPASSEPLHP